MSPEPHSALFPVPRQQAPGLLTWGPLAGAPSRPLLPHRPHSVRTRRVCGHPRPQEGLEHCALRTETQGGRVGMEAGVPEHSGSFFKLSLLHQSLVSSLGLWLLPRNTQASPPLGRWFLPDTHTHTHTHTHHKASRIHPRGTQALPCKFPGLDLSMCRVGVCDPHPSAGRLSPQPPSPRPRDRVGGGDIKAHHDLAGGVPARTVAASTGSGSASWTCTNTKWSSSRPPPTRSFSGLREAADRWVQTALCQAQEATSCRSAVI